MRAKSHGSVVGGWAGECYDVVNDAILSGKCGISLTYESETVIIILIKSDDTTA